MAIRNVGFTNFILNSIIANHRQYNLIFFSECIIAYNHFWWVIIPIRTKNSRCLLLVMFLCFWSYKLSRVPKTISNHIAISPTSTREITDNLRLTYRRRLCERSLFRFARTRYPNCLQLRVNKLISKEPRSRYFCFLGTAQDKLRRLKSRLKHIPLKWIKQFYSQRKSVLI